MTGTAMPCATIDGLQINYVTLGNGPLLMWAKEAVGLLDDLGIERACAARTHSRFILSSLMPPQQSSASVTAWIRESVATAAKRTR